MTDAFGGLVAFAWGPEPVAWVQEVFGPHALRVFAAVTVLGESEAVAVALLFWGFGRSPAYARGGQAALGPPLCLLGRHRGRARAAFHVI